MGMDQHAFKFADNPEDNTVIMSWRKHYNLDMWMNRLYCEKGGKEEFNCVHVEINLADLDRLEKDMKDETWPFAGNETDEYYEESVMTFINEAREDLANGLKVGYISWW